MLTLTLTLTKDLILTQFAMPTLILSLYVEDTPTPNPDTHPDRSLSLAQAQDPCNLSTGHVIDFSSTKA